MRDTSFVVAPIRDHAFFQQTVFECQVGHAFLQGTRFAAQILHLAGGRGTGSVARQAALARFHELLRPGVVQALRDAFLAAQLGNRSEEHTSELQSLMRISYAVFCLKKKIYCESKLYKHVHKESLYKHSANYYDYQI